jgi:hypothetical protein
MKNRILSFTALLFLSACLDKENFSEIPAIRYENAVMNKNDASIDIKISFTDGDGDIGLKQNEDYPPYGPCDQYYYNLFIDPYYMDNGNFRIGRKAVDTNCAGDSVKVGYYYRMIYIVPEGKDKSLEGEITVSLNGVLLDYPDDTVKFRIWMVDRAFHMSNVVESAIFITP